MRVSSFYYGAKGWSSKMQFFCLQVFPVFDSAKNQKTLKPSTVMFKILHGTFVPLGRAQRGKRSQIPPLAGSRIALARIQPEFPGFKFLNHIPWLARVRAALRAAADKPAGVLVWIALAAARERSLAVRFIELRRVCREIAR
jgi:hypothetical protein